MAGEKMLIRKAVGASEEMRITVQRQTRREFLKIAGLATAALGDISIQPKVFGDPKHRSSRETHAGEMDKWLNRTGWPA